MVNPDDLIISPLVKTALSNFGSTVKKMIPPLGDKITHYSGKDDEFKHSGEEPLSPRERVHTAIKKFNFANDLRIAAETNYYAEFYHDYNLLQEYMAYKNPELKDLTFTPVSQDTLSAIYKGKQVKITSETLEDKSKQYDIKFEDGSQISYVIFSEGGKMNINGEDFKMPAGTILETKSVDGRAFSKLIQTPDMRMNVINKPEIIDTADQLLLKS